MSGYVGLTDKEAEQLCELITSVDSGDSDMEEIESSEYSSDTDNECPLEDNVRASTSKSAKNKCPPPNLKWIKDELFHPRIYPFDEESSGFHADTFEIQDDSSILEYFEIFFSNNLAGKIAAETNRYYDFVIKNCPKKMYSRLNKWKETDWEEIYLFIAMTMLVSRNRKLKLNECWSKDPLINTPIFQKSMARDRYLLLLRLLHFCNNDDSKPGNRLYKLDMVLEEFKCSFHQSFTPFENLCIDESLILYKGRLSFKQFIRTKRHRFGIKLFVLTDVETDYVLDFIVYTGSSTRIRDTDPNLGISGAIVATLMEPYLGKGHNLYTDNWYTSPILAEYLHDQKTNLCGTVRKNRREMPKLEDPKKSGEVRTAHTEKIMVMCWKDKRVVSMLSTLHTANMLPTKKVMRDGTAIVKPACVIDYNQNMGSVDKIDMLLSSTECVRKTLKWYKKLFFHLVDLVVVNAHAMYKVKTGQHITLASFQLELIRQLIAKYQKEEKQPKGGRPSSGDIPDRLKGRHFPQLVPPVPGGKQNSQRICYVCKHSEIRPKKRRDSRYFCPDCNVGLCIVPCFELFHTLKKF